MTRFLETRKGFTLTEVLMAMFVMAIGMLSLLALFPVAFQNAKWALDTEQVARGAANAQSTTELPHVFVNAAGNVSNTAKSIRNDDSYSPNSVYNRWIGLNPTDVATSLTRDVFLKHPVTGQWSFQTNLNAKPAGSAVKVVLPPVFVDPMFIANNPIMSPAPLNLPFHVGVNSVTDPTLLRAPFAINSAGLPALVSTNRPAWSVGIPRLSLSQYSRDLGAVKLRLQTESSMGDEINFDTNGQPLAAGGQFASQRRFTWAYMCHWPDYTNNNADICEVTTIVFNARPETNGLSNFPAGEATYSGHPSASLAAGTEPAGFTFGRIFVKGLSQTAISLPTPEPMKLKAGDWILDSTMVLPDYNSANPNEVAPFLDTFNTAFVYTAFPDGTPFPSGSALRPGLVGGHFYKVLDVSEVRQLPPALPGTNRFFQTITLDRPAKSDGFSATVMSGIADVITKGAGKMPQR